MKRLFMTLVLFLVLPTAMTVHAENDTPQEGQDQSIYYIMVDRFMNGTTENDYETDLENPKAYHGGDIDGVIKQLDHIKELGFTTIELSPIMKNEGDGFHGFWTEDYRSVEEHFGTMEEARRLVEEAHARDMKVIFDMVIGYTSENHSWTEDVNKDEWYQSNVNQDERMRWTRGLPALDLENSEVQQYFAETVNFWVEETGVDGFRFHHGSKNPEDFLNQLDQQEDTQGLFLISEGPESIVDATVDQLFFNEVRSTFKTAGGSLEELHKNSNDKNLTISEKSTIKELNNFKDVRFTHLAVKEGQNPITRLKLALTYLYTSPGIPVVYYGTEVPLDDGGNLEENPMMNFKANDEQLKQRIEKLNSMRKEFPAMTKGNFEEVYNQDGMAVFKRTHEDQTMLVAINNAEETKTASLKGLEQDQQLRGLLHDGLVRQHEDGSYRIGMERETADVFVVEEDQGYNWLFIGFVGGVLGLFIIAVTILSLKSRKAASEEG
ncbi:alpha-amylase family glycosyl hydrolase [Halobacillus yeomjeoni]|uniref:Alpha-amylase n=1 Tax=Halobacillus yeomjeoni TaxID=311194 RepID=A0A931HSW2_9BACI|nr:alpha-amylase family glycosyl hydrolase [Halobacillus yeomjeoni]MBH0228754.1 alpha-amylase [Halobacillus yeomjeoni]